MLGNSFIGSTAKNVFWIFLLSQIEESIYNKTFFTVKTTLIKLLLGYYNPVEGDIRVGGNDLRSFSLLWWRDQCGAVMQDGYLFSESIARNIAVDDGEIDKSRLLLAARIANIEGFIERLPSFLIRWGNTILVVIFALLALIFAWSVCF